MCDIGSGTTTTTILTTPPTKRPMQPKRQQLLKFFFHKAKQHQQQQQQLPKIALILNNYLCNDQQSMDSSWVQLIYSAIGNSTRWVAFWSGLEHHYLLFSSSLNALAYVGLFAGSIQLCNCYESIILRNFFLAACMKSDEKSLPLFEKNFAWTN